MLLPDELNDDLADILGMMIFRSCPIAHAMRDGGESIPPKTEVEQATVLFKLLGIYAEHGAGWRKAAGNWLHDVSERAKAAKAAQADGGAKP